MNRKHFMVLAITGIITISAGVGVWSHCQVPCGIYDDGARFTQMLEHATTIEKAMNQITILGAEEKPNYNQLVRWVNAKEKHADDLADIVTYYFMAQRIKPVGADDKEGYAKYLRELTTLHQILVGTMKAKQTTDLVHVEGLRKNIALFKGSYMVEHDHK